MYFIVNKEAQWSGVRNVPIDVVGKHPYKRTWTLFFFPAL